MNQNETFVYTHSAKENKEVMDIRKKYLSHEETPIEKLRQLDKNVKKPANVFALVFGSISAIIMGAGMSLVMTDIGQTLGISNTMPIGIIIGIIGMLLAIVNYPMYKSTISKRRKKYADEIIALSDSIMKG